MVRIVDTQRNEELAAFESYARAHDLYLTLLRLHPPAAHWLALVQDDALPAAA
jgi:hypothetical protein